MVPPASHGISRAPRYSGYTPVSYGFRLQASHLLRGAFPCASASVGDPYKCPQPPAYCYPGFGLNRFRSPLLAVSRLISLPRPTEMFQFGRFPTYPYFVQDMLRTHSDAQVSPFGYLRINAHLQLPAAFRSLSRPSSAPSAKAFSLCSFSLDLL